MKTYTVTVKEIHNSYVEVQADSPEDAIRRVNEGEGDEVDCDYNETLDSSTWNAHENEIQEKN